MSMYNDYSFFVDAIHPSALLQYQSGKVTTQRQFRMQCRYAEEFALRQIGKFWVGSGGDFDAYPLPVLPVPFPFDGLDEQPRGYGRMNLVASGFSITPISVCCFNNNAVRVDGIADPADIDSLERYFKSSPEDVEDPWEPEDVDSANEDCECTVTISYEENPCDCCGYETNSLSENYGEWVTHESLLENTCISVERNPAYEMFTLPNGGLIWEGLPGSTEEELDARRLKSDSYAYKIIPKADIIVHWHNVPVAALCAIESHLTLFRGTVNDTNWGDVLFCDQATASEEPPTPCGCGKYEPETILFVDWQEDRSKRTDAFGGSYLSSGTTQNNMNTTTLKLFLKQKRITKPTTASYSDSDDCIDDNDEAYGWNHLFLDRKDPAEIDEWMRVVVEATGEPLFTPKSFTNLMKPII